jgi:fructose-1,6-bisphosphatase I
LRREGRFCNKRLVETSSKIVTIQRHIMEQQALHPAATGEFTRLLWDLVLAFKMISREVNRAGLAAILGLAGKENVQGEQVTKLDDYAQSRITEQMDHGGHLCCMASEEVDGSPATKTPSHTVTRFALST